MKASLVRGWSVVITLMAVFLSGCSTGVHATSWPGLTLADGVVYVAALEGASALDAESGEVQWTYPQEKEEQGGGLLGKLFSSGPSVGLFYGAPAVTDELVLVADFPTKGGGTVRALDREDGREVWTFDRATGGYVAGGALADGVLVIGNGDGTVYALDVEDGSLLWWFRTDDRVWATPLVVSDTVYVAALDHHLYALTVSSGHPAWVFEAGGAMMAAPVFSDGLLFVGAFDSQLYALNADDGSVHWRFTGQNWFAGSPALAEGVVYAADADGNVYAVEADTGREVWHRQVASTVRAGPVLSEDGSTLFVAGYSSGTLYALDAADGDEVWTRQGEGQLGSPPLVDTERVYLTPMFGPQQVQALDVDTGRMEWVYPPPEEE